MIICICDDEPIYCERLTSEIKKYMTIYKLNANISIFNSITDFNNADTYFDIIFMDIELKDGNGLKTIMQNKKYNDSFVVFFTSHKEEAVNGYKANAFRFLVKPVQYEELVEVLSSALKIKSEAKRIVVNIGTIEMCFKINDIIYVEANNKNVGIRTKNDFFEFRGTLRSLREQINSLNFFCPHKSYIVNLDYIQSFDNKYIVLINNEQIPISRLKKAEFVKAFYSYIRRKAHE